MQMVAEDIKKYKKFARYVSTSLPDVARVSAIMSAIEKYSGAKRETVKQGLVWGQGPIVKVEMLVPVERGGRVYTPTGGYTPHTNTIGIPVRHVGLYEAGQDLRKAPKGFQVHLVGVILLHELTHWAREQAGLADTPDVEEGFEFEKQVYGGVIDR